MVGLGLMGGSLARALARLEPRPRIVGVSHTPSHRDGAVAEGVVDCAFSTTEEALEQFPTPHLVVFATPLGITLQLLRRLPEAMAGVGAITDLASLNRPVLEVVTGTDLAPRLVTSHPMVGGEASGFEASRDGLYVDGPVHLSTSPTAAPAVRQQVEGFWRALGARPHWMVAREHDQVMVMVSHLPQLVSNALAGALDSAGVAPSALGPGGQDMVRLAGSSPEMWVDLLAHSGPEAAPALRGFARAVDALADLLVQGDLDAVARFMERTRKWRGK